MPINAKEETAKDSSKEDSNIQHVKESDESSSESTEEEEEEGEEEEEEEEGVALDNLSEEDVDEDVIPQQQVTINNKSVLKKIYQDIKLDVPWIETQAITSLEPADIKDVNNDIERELTFYKQALEATIEGRKKIIESGVTFSRPDDYFAEMVKSDEHMTKIREKLIDEEQKIKASEEAKRKRELKKFGKKVQIERLQERQKQKREDLEKIKAMKKKRKGIEDTAVDDDFDIALEEAADEDNRPNNKPNKKQKFGKSSKRSYKDVKFGFGGKKRHIKSNTAQSSGDLSIFDGGKSTRKKKITKTRPGKARRQAARNKRQ